MALTLDLLGSYREREDPMIVTEAAVRGRSKDYFERRRRSRCELGWCCGFFCQHGKRRGAGG